MVVGGPRGKPERSSTIFPKGALIHTDVCLRPAALVAAAPRWGKPHTPGHRLGNTNALEQERRQHGFFSLSYTNDPTKYRPLCGGCLAAYRSGAQIVNTWDGTVHDYTRKQHVVYNEVMLPANAPPHFADRSMLWNSVEWAEKKRDAQLAREVEMALPKELPRVAQIKLVRKFVQKEFVDAGMCADVAIHDKEDGNPHAHILLTVRPLNSDGSWAQKADLFMIWMMPGSA